MPYAQDVRIQLVQVAVVQLVEIDVPAVQAGDDGFSTSVRPIDCVVTRVRRRLRASSARGRSGALVGEVRERRSEFLPRLGLTGAANFFWVAGRGRCDSQ